MGILFVNGGAAVPMYIGIVTIDREGDPSASVERKRKPQAGGPERGEMITTDRKGIAIRCIAKHLQPCKVFLRLDCDLVFGIKRSVMFYRRE